MKFAFKENFFAIFLLVSLFVLLFIYYPSREKEKPKVVVRSLTEYHKEFRKADGSFYSDSELAELLVAKGIPFGLEAKEVAKKENSSLEISITFLSANFSISEQREIQKSFSENYFNWYHGLSPQFSRGLELQKVFVTFEKKIQVFFNRNFEKIAQDESLLTEFNEAFASLGFLGLRGMEIFIEEKPLSFYLKELDQKRDEKASRENYRGPSLR